MGHLLPNDENGRRKDPAEYSVGELRGISAEIYREQMHRHEAGQHVDKAALEKAVEYSARAADEVMRSQCAALIDAVPIAPPPAGSTISNRRAR